MKNTESKSPLSNLMKIGIMVKDASETAARLKSMVNWEFKSMEGKLPFEEKVPKSEPEGFLTRVGDITIEIFRPIEGEPHFKNFKESKGEGIHDLGFVVSDLEDGIDKFTKQGAKMLSRSKHGPVEFADFDSGFGDVIFQLIKRG